MKKENQEPSLSEIQEENGRLKSAMRRAHFCLTDGRRVGDAIQILKVAFPTVGQGDPNK